MATATELVAYERAARAVFTPLHALLDRRAQRDAAGEAPDAVPALAQLADMAVWSGGAAYLIADAIVAAFSGLEAAAADEAVGLWAITALRGVEDWTLAATDPVRIQTMRLPGRPPDPPAEAAGEPMARAALAALGSLHAQVAGDLAALRRRLDAGDHRPPAAEQLLAHAGAVLQFARPLTEAGSLTSEQADGVLARVLPAITQVFQAGQAVAAPLLFADLGTAPIPASPAAGRTTAGEQAPPGAARRWAEPGSADFDRWCLTDPHSRLVLRTPERTAALDAMWRLPGAATLVTLQNLLEESVASGDVTYARAGHGRYLGYFHRAPWAPVYEAARPVRLGPTRLAAGDTFTFQVGELDPEPVLPAITVDTYRSLPEGGVRGTVARTAPAPAPGEPGFDPWALTDPHVRAALQRLAAARELLDAVWTGGTAVALVATADAIAVAAAQGRVSPAQNPNGTWRAPLRPAPWPTVWVTREVVTIAGTELRAGVEVALSPRDGGLVTGPFGDAEVLPLPPTEAGLRGPDAPVEPEPALPPVAARATTAPPAAPPPPPTPLPAPATPAEPEVFDLETHRWALTDPHSRSRLRRDPDAVARIDAFWAQDGDPAASLAAGRAVEAAVARGDLAYATLSSGAWAPALEEPPFPARLISRRPQTLLGTPLAEEQAAALEIVHTPDGTRRRLRRLH